MINAREFSSHMSLCIRYGIVIYPIFYSRGKYKIAIKRDGKEKIGDDVYEDTAVIDKKTKERTPAIHEKIHSLYRLMANRIRNQKTK